MLTTTKVVIGDMMRELVYYVAVSIDGYIAAPDGSYDAFPVEGDHMAVYLSDFAPRPCTLGARYASAG